MNFYLLSNNRYGWRAPAILHVRGVPVPETHSNADACGATIMTEAVGRSAAFAG
jgi:hypothetical protein